MLSFFQTAAFLWSHTPLAWFAVVVFGLTGYWYGYVSWYVSERRLRVLRKERERLKASVDKLREQFDEANAVVEQSGHRIVPDYDDFTVLPGVDPFACARLHQTGIRYFDQLAELEALDEAELEKFRLTLGIGRFRLDDWRWIWDGKAEPAESQHLAAPSLRSAEVTKQDRDLGLTFLERPEFQDDLALIEGLSDRLAATLNELGIYRFSQISSWDEPAIAVIETKLGLKIGTIDQNRWIDQAKPLAQWSRGLRMASFVAPSKVAYIEVLDRQFAGQNGIRIDDEFGLVYDYEPEVCDDLTQIEGVDEDLAWRLRGAGIYRFRQIANWSDNNIEALCRRMEIPKETIETGKWIPHAGLLDKKIYAASRIWLSGRPLNDEIAEVIEERFAEEAVSADEDYGVIYMEQPGHWDALEALDGMDPHLEFALNSAGVWCFKQIAVWSSTNVETYAERLKMNPEMIYHLGWIGKAATLECSESDSPQSHQLASSSRDLLTQGAHLDDRLGLIFHREPHQIDNLKKIRGIGTKLQERLRSAGVYRYDQIALWTPEVMDAFGEILRGARRRIVVDRWQEQAKELLQKKSNALLPAPRNESESDGISLTP